MLTAQMYHAINDAKDALNASWRHIEHEITKSPEKYEGDVLRVLNLSISKSQEQVDLLEGLLKREKSAEVIQAEYLVDTAS